MKTTNLAFDNKTYVCRVVNSNEGEELIIAPISLLDALHPYPFDGFVSKAAVQLDERVFFYTNDADLKCRLNPKNDLVKSYIFARK